METVAFNLVDCKRVEVKKCKYGVGAFSSVEIKEGDLVEIGIVRTIDIDPSVNEYVFSWNRSNTLWAIPSGCLMFYNHSKTPNTKVIKYIREYKIEVYAIRNIKKGEKLTHFYKGLNRKCFSNLEG